MSHPNATSAPNGAKLGFGDGARALWGGLRFLLATPRSWPLAAVPMVLAFVLVIACVVGGAVLAQHLLEPASPHASSSSSGSLLSELASSLLAFAVLVISLILGVVLGLSLAIPLSAPALDALAKLRLRSLGAGALIDAASRDESFLRSMGRSLRVVALALAVGLPALAILAVLTALVPPLAVVTIPAKFVVATALATWDVFDYAFGLERLGVRARLGWLATHRRAAFAFGAVFAAIALVPGLGLLAIPVGVAGAAELWALSRRASRGAVW